jgi:hypothetical protein
MYQSTIVSGSNCWTSIPFHYESDLIKALTFLDLPSIALGSVVGGVLSHLFRVWAMQTLGFREWQSFQCHRSNGYSLAFSYRQVMNPGDGEFETLTPYAHITSAWSGLAISGLLG